MQKSIVFDFINVIYDSKSGDLNPAVVSLISSLYEEGFPLYIFTNTSKENIELIDNKKNFLKYFKKVIYNFEFPKPSPRSFEKLISELKCDATDIVLVDDREENVSIGKDFGIIGILFTNVGDLKIKLSEVLKL
ncbi:MAG: HAD-IA family hydrolase [Candidatus Dojkabacteria bacterium]